MELTEQYPYLLRVGNDNMWLPTIEERNKWVKKTNYENPDVKVYVADGEIAHSYALLIADLEINGILYREEVRLDYGYGMHIVEGIAHQQWNPVESFCRKHSWVKPEDIKVKGKRITFVR